MHTSSVSNIEPIARVLCEQALRPTYASEDELAAAVDRYWHCVAAEIESGIINDAGEIIKHDVDFSVASYQDWRERHPDYVPPAL